MKMPTERLAAFSDGVIAIIITIMVLEIPLPEVITHDAVGEFLKSIGIYFVSFMVVGVQWNRHHTLFYDFKEGTQQIFWRNILYLFFLSLVPIFTKWIMENPNEVIPAFGYSIVYMLTMLSFYFMKFRLIRDNWDSEYVKNMQKIRENQIEEFKERKLGKNGDVDIDLSELRRFFVLRVGILVIILIGLFISSYYYPEIGILLFIVFPIVSSLFNMWSDGWETRRNSKRKNRNIN